MLSLRGKHWINEDLQQILSDDLAFEASYHLCAMGIKVTEDSTDLSAVVMHSYTTFPSEPIRCKHKPGTPHTYELTKLGPQRAHLWISAKSKVCKLLWAKWKTNFPVLSLASLPDSLRHTVVKEDQGDDTRNDTPNSVFPTLAKEQEKARKKVGYKAKKIQKIVEDKFDDLGSCLDGLGPDVKIFLLDISIEEATYDTDDEAEALVHNLQYWFPMGDDTPHPTSNIFTQTELESSFLALFQSGIGLDICELCGGVGRPSQIAIRRRLRTGKNFDLVTGFDLGNAAHQSVVKKYVKDNQVLVVLMAPSCRTLGPTSNVNAAINFDTWLEHYEQDKPHIHFCGEIAMIQIDNTRFFFGENPWPTYLLKEGKWPTVTNHPTTRIEVVHQCRLGAKGPNKLPVKKPTMLISNSTIILEEFQDLKCDGKHQHDVTWGSGQLAKLQVWPWQLCERLINGIVNLRRKYKQHHNYPNLEQALEIRINQLMRNALGRDAQGAKAEWVNTAVSTHVSPVCVGTPMLSQSKNFLAQAVPGDRHVRVGTRTTLKFQMNVDGELSAAEM